MKSLPKFSPGLLSFLFLLLAPIAARADTILLLEDPVNFEGKFTSSGHTALWMDSLCSDDHTHLRPCHPGEPGAVISRYPGHPAHLDWLAMPVNQYLFAADTPSQVPTSITRAEFAQLESAARAQLAPTFAQDPGPKVWIQLLGESYRRRIVLVRVHTSLAQEMRMMNWLNHRPNISHFNFASSNCSDFVGAVLDQMLPGGFHRSYLFDSGMMTPKENMADLHHYALRHRELGWQVTILPQLPGDIKRSGHARGVTEAYLKSWWFFLPLDYLLPIELGAVTASGLADHRYIPKPTQQADLTEFFAPIQPASSLSQ